MSDESMAQSCLNMSERTCWLEWIHSLSSWWLRRISVVTLSQKCRVNNFLSCPAPTTLTQVSTTTECRTVQPAQCNRFSRLLKRLNWSAVKLHSEERESRDHLFSHRHAQHNYFYPEDLFFPSSRHMFNSKETTNSSQVSFKIFWTKWECQSIVIIMIFRFCALINYTRSTILISTMVAVSRK